MPNFATSSKLKEEQPNTPVEQRQPFKIPNANRTIKASSILPSIKSRPKHSLPLVAPEHNKLKIHKIDSNTKSTTIKEPIKIPLPTKTEFNQTPKITKAQVNTLSEKPHIAIPARKPPLTTMMEKPEKQPSITQEMANKVREGKYTYLRISDI